MTRLGHSWCPSGPFLEADVRGHWSPFTWMSCAFFAMQKVVGSSPIWIYDRLEEVEEDPRNQPS